MIRKAILIPGELNSKEEKMLISVKLLAKHVKIFFSLGSAHGKESQSKPFQRSSKVEIPGRARGKEWLSRFKLK